MPFYVSAAILVVGGAIQSADASRKSAHKTEDANDLAARIEDAHSHHERVLAMKQERIQAARAQNAAAAQGLEGSSSVQGAVSGLESAQGAEIAFADSINRLNKIRLDDLSAAAGAQARGAYGQAAMSIGSMAFGGLEGANGGAGVTPLAGGG